MTSHAPKVAEPSGQQIAAITAVAPPGLERRGESRRPLQNIPGTLTVLDGPDAGANHPVIIRDVSRHGLAFFAARPLTAGDIVRLHVNGSRHNTQIRLCRVVRSIAADGGHEVAVQSELLELP